MKRRIVIVLALGLLAGPAVAEPWSLPEISGWWQRILEVLAPAVTAPGPNEPTSKSTTTPTTDPAPATDGTLPLPGSACIDPNGLPKLC